MSFKHSTPGSGKGIVKSAIAQTGVGKVTAHRNPNRPRVDAQTKEELDKEKDEKDEDLRARFNETVAREFSSKDNSLQRLQQQQNQQNQMAQMAAMNRGAGGFQMPKLPSGGGSTPKKNNNSTTGTRSDPKPQKLDKPDLTDNKRPETKPKINPLQQPGQSQNRKPEQERSRSADSRLAKDGDTPLKDAVSSDAIRVADLRRSSTSTEENLVDSSKAYSQKLLDTYTNNGDQHSLGAHEARRLVQHGIAFNADVFKPGNSPQQNDALVNGLISRHNEARLAKLGNGNEIAQHYSKMGFQRGEYSQLAARQLSDSYNYIQQVKADPNSRADKQALILLPEKGATEFDMTKEVEDLRRLGFQPVFAQFDSENGFRTHDENGKATALKELAHDLGGFDALVIGGHGLNAGTPAIRFGEKLADNATKAQIAQGEEAYLDRGDFRNDPDIRAFFEDKEILKEGGTIASCSCSFTGSDANRGEQHIKPEESLAAIIQDIRPDADILGAFDEVLGSESKYTMDADGKLQNPTMRRLDEPKIDSELIAQLEAVEENRGDDTELLLDNLDDLFDEDYEDL